MLTQAQSTGINTTETQHYQSELAFEASGREYTRKEDPGGLCVYFNGDSLAGFRDYEREQGESMLAEMQTV